MALFVPLTSTDTGEPRYPISRPDLAPGAGPCISWYHRPFPWLLVHCGTLGAWIRQPRQRLAAAYASSTEATDRRNHRVAHGWRWDADAERLLLLMAAGHPVTPHQRMAVGYYTEGKRAAEAVGIDTGGQHD